LDILPGIRDNTIRCAIRTISLDGDENYEALSYVWGTRGMDEKIEVGERQIAVTSNLHLALQRLRHKDKKRTVWIDQLCINQLDNFERASQIAMMRDIYWRCSSCIIWLGELDEHAQPFSLQDATAVFDFIKEVAAVERIGPRPLPTVFRNTPEGEAARTAFAAFAMYGNAWWSRIWTVQEAVIPQSAVFVWGHMSLSRDDVFRASRYLRISVTQEYFSKEFTRLRIQFYELIRRLLYPMHGFLHSKGGEGPLDLLMRWRHREATDPRDKVYALMGLISVNTLPSAERYDYEMPPSLLFSRVTFDLIQVEKGLRPLIGSSEMPHHTPSVPSWAIDFANSNHVGRRQLKWWNHSHRYHEFSACGAHALQASLHEGDKVLGLTGLCVDSVEQTSSWVYRVPDDAPIFSRALSDFAKHCEDIILGWRIMHGDPVEYVAGGTWNSAISRTFIGDLIMAEFPVERAKLAHENYLVDLGTALQDNSHGSINESLCGMVPNHAFFITSKGYIGMGPPHTKSGDQVWILYGGRVPFVLRKAPENSALSETQKFTLVGDAYVHGIMDGQMVQDNLETRTIWLC
jgi:hypothetical protein